MKKIVRTICQACHCECGVLVHVEDDKVAKVVGDPKHHMNKGFICVKGQMEPHRTYHPDRLKYPIRRVGGRGEGKWERISWDVALDAIAQKLTEIKEKYGPESIASINGTGPRQSLFSARIPYALGSPNCISVDLHICYAPSIVAELSTIGHSISMEKGPDYEFADCIVVWGGNPLMSHPPRGVEIVNAQLERGAKLIVIDPRKTQLAARADLWLQIRPGTDGALALGMINTIIEEGLYEKEFVSKWCYGFNELRERVKEFTPTRVAEITQISPDKIIEVARMYAKTKPAALHRRLGIDQTINSTQTGRAIASLIAITGNIDVKGGNLIAGTLEGYIYSHVLTGQGKMLAPDRKIVEKRIGSKEFPLISGLEAFFPFVPSFLAFETMATDKPYPIKALYCAGANPLINVQNSRFVLDALRKLDLLVVVDFFMTPTAEFADYVLPATTWLEREECCDIPYMNLVSARQKAIEPLYECWDDLKIIIELIKRIPWADRDLVPWDDVNECYDYLVAGLGIKFDELKRKGYLVIPREYKKYEENRFNTPTGKVELYSTIFEKNGYDPLPSYREPIESLISTPQIIKDYPLILTTGSRYIEYFCSEGRQIAQLREKVPDPLVDIHPDTARGLNINDGDWVWVETPKVEGERVRFKANITNDISPGVVHAAYGWWFPEKPGPEHGCFDSNISVVLSADSPREEICGSVPLRSTLCRIYKCTV